MNNEPHTQKPDDQFYDDGIDLMHHVLLFWRHRLVIVLGTLLCGLAVFVAGMLTPRTYEATAKLVVSPPKTGAVADNAPMVGVATYRALVENQSLGAAIVKEFGLGNEPYRVTPDKFITRRVKVEMIRDTNVIVVKVRLWDRDLAAKVANRLAERAVQLSQQLNQEETVSARDVIRDQLDQSKKRLDQAEQRLEEFKRKAQIELLRKDVDALLGQRGALLGLLVEIQAEQARLSQAEAQLANRGRIDTLKRSIDTDPAAMEAARRGSSDSTVLPLQLRNEFVNPVYESLDEVIASSRTRLAGLQKQKSELIDVRKFDRDQQAKLSLLYEREMELSRLQTEYDLSRAVYVEVATHNEQARLQVAGRSAQLQVLDAALPPDLPVSPRVLRNTAVALVLGLILMVTGVLSYTTVGAAVARENAQQR